MTDVHLIGLGPGNDPRSLALSSWRRVQECERIFYPGNWINAHLLEAFGTRLIWGRHLKTADAVAAAFESKQRGESIAVLFNGDGRFFSGRHGIFASMVELEAELSKAGLLVRSWPGLTSAQAALSAAGWHIPAEPSAGFMTSAPLCRGQGGRAALHAVARCPAVLALLWCEDHAMDVFEVIGDVRGDGVPVALVYRLGGASQEVTQGPLFALRACFEALEPPAVILVAQPRAPGPAPSGHLGFIGPQHTVGEWP